ncbi:MAG TPA: DNA-3-methyladenine glycosylase [Terriglobales bacterium]|nr:DNA-3-methyladenine glycosylase [Terriglobales bacterium]
MRKAINHLKKADPVMAEIIARVGPPRPLHRPATFWAMVRSIVFQQLAGAAARTIFDRLERACAAALGVTVAPNEIPPAEGSAVVTPEAILQLSEEQMRACGLSRQKLSYIRDLAEKARSGEVDFAKLPQMSDEQVIEHLTRVKGIGVWSAQMFLMFALHRLDVMPTVDFGINTAICRHYRKRKMPKAKQILKLAECWRPYRSVACFYLWRSMDKPNAATGKKVIAPQRTPRTRTIRKKKQKPS